MPTVQDVFDALESIAPFRWCLPEDGSGFQVGNGSAEVQSAIVSLDWSQGLLDFAVQCRAQLIVTHHPLLYHPTRDLTDGSAVGGFALKLAQRGIAIIAAHTNWDAAPGGISDTMAALLGLTDVRPLGVGAEISYSKLVTFCPEESVEKVAETLAAAGAGLIGDYDHCSFRSDGVGTFRGLEGSNPAVGQPGRLERAPEVRLEVRFSSPRQAAVIEALRASHPYEEPAFDVYPLAPVVEMPLGRVGALPRPMDLSEFKALADERFGSISQAWGRPDQRIQTVALSGGAADFLCGPAHEMGADAYVTGEVRHHVGLEWSERGMGVLACGHYHTEHPGCVALGDRLAGSMPEIDWRVFEPEPGISGRPSC